MSDSVLVVLRGFGWGGGFWVRILGAARLDSALRVWGMGLRCTLGGWAGWGGRCVHAGPRGPFASRSRGFAGGKGQHYRGMTAPTLRGGEACPFPIPVLYPFAGDYIRADYPCPGTAVHHYLSPKLALGVKYVEVTPGGLERIVGDPNDG